MFFLFSHPEYCYSQVQVFQVEITAAIWDYQIASKLASKLGLWLLVGITILLLVWVLAQCKESSTPRAFNLDLPTGHSEGKSHL